jgi:alcohol dehydrogenase
VTADGEFYMPTRVFFGRGLAGQAGAHAAGLSVRRVMLVTDPGVQAAGIADPVRVQLIAAGLEVVDFQQVEPNPRDVDCLAGADLAAEFGAEGLVAVGGGSAIDSAKCIALLRTNGGHPRDWEDFGALRHDPLPVLAIPTTAGTGSEVSPSAVITDTVRRKKMNLFETPVPRRIRGPPTPRRSPPCSPARWVPDLSRGRLRRPMDVPFYRIDPVESPSH